MTHLGVDFVCVCVCCVFFNLKLIGVQQENSFRLGSAASLQMLAKPKSRNQNYDYKWRKGEILRIEARCAVSRGTLCLSTTDYCCCCFPSSAAVCQRQNQLRHIGFACREGKREQRRGEKHIKRRAGRRRRVIVPNEEGIQKSISFSFLSFASALSVGSRICCHGYRHHLCFSTSFSLILG